MPSILQVNSYLVPPPDDIFVNSISAAHIDTGYYIHNSTLPRAPAATISAPARDAGDYLLAIAYSPGGDIVSSGGNYTLEIQGASNVRQVYGRVATGDSNDDYLLPETTGNQYDQKRERYVQIICIKSSSGVPTFLERIGEDVSDNTYNYTCTNRTLPSVETENILSIANYAQADETGGVAAAGPYELTSVPPGTTEIGFGGGALDQPNARYWFAGWAYEYMPAVSTKAISEITYTPTNPTLFGVESSWLAFYSV